MFVVKKGEIIEIDVISTKENKCIVQDRKSKREFETHKIDVCSTIEEARIVKKEIEIKRKFKTSRKNKGGKHICAWCGKQGKNLTVDHKKSLKSFGGKKSIRKNKEIWSQAWDVNNLQMLCEECNQHKEDYKNSEDGIPLERIDYHARILNNKKILKKCVHKSSPANKIGYCLATSKRATNKKTLVEYVAKADSNILRLDMVLNTKEIYDFLPKTI